MVALKILWNTRAKEMKIVRVIYAAWHFQKSSSKKTAFKVSNLHNMGIQLKAKAIVWVIYNFATIVIIIFFLSNLGVWRKKNVISEKSLQWLPGPALGKKENL